jgi:hypothetical protein
MPDFADIGSDYTERWLEAQISEHQYQLNQTGNEPEEQVCRNCKEPLSDGRHYCDTECALDYETRQKAMKRRGRNAE